MEKHDNHVSHRGRRRRGDGGGAGGRGGREARRLCKGSRGSSGFQAVKFKPQSHPVTFHSFLSTRWQPVPLLVGSPAGRASRPGRWGRSWATRAAHAEYGSGPAPQCCRCACCACCRHPAGCETCLRGWGRPTEGRAGSSPTCRTRPSRPSRTAGTAHSARPTSSSPHPETSWARCRGLGQGSAAHRAQHSAAH